MTTVASNPQKSKEFIPNFLKIKGTLTSSCQLRGENTKEPYYYAFVRLPGQAIDLPCIFKTKTNGNLTALKKGDDLILTGHYSNSAKSIRKSFTAYDYQLTHDPSS